MSLRLLSQPERVIIKGDSSFSANYRRADENHAVWSECMRL